MTDGRGGAITITQGWISKEPPTAEDVVAYSERGQGLAGAS
jgi:hypothetical protein